MNRPGPSGGGGRRPAAFTAPAQLAELNRAVSQGLQGKIGSAAACMLSAPRGRERAQVLHHGVLGTAKLGPPLVRLTDDARFDLGGLTATVATATLAAVLVGRHRIDLSRTLETLSGADVGLREGPWRKLTLESLLDHTSGLPDERAAFAAALAPLQAMGAAPVRSAAEQLHAPAASTRRRGEREVRSFGGPLDDAGTAALRARLQATVPVANVGAVQRHSALNALALGWALEAVLEQPLDVAFAAWVAEPLQIAAQASFVRCGPDGPWAPRRSAIGQSDVAAGPRCSFRRRVLHGEPACPVAYYLGGAAGHAGLFADVRAVHAILLAHLDALEGRSSPLNAGVVQRFWSRSKRVVDSTWALGWQVVSRDNGMAPGRWNGRSVGGSVPGAAAFVDPSFGVVGALLCNVDQAPDAVAAGGWEKMRRQVFDLMASFGQYAQGVSKAPPRARGTF